MPRKGIRKSLGRKKSWLIAAVAAAGLAVTVHLAMRAVLSTEFLQHTFSRALADASGGLYRISLGSTSFDLVRNRMRATDVALYPDSALVADAVRGDTPEALYSISAPVVVVEGTHLFALLRGRIKASSLRLLRPHLHIALDNRRALPPDTSAAAAAAEAVADTARISAADSLAASFHVRLARQLPRMSIRLLQIDSAAFSWERRVGGEDTRDSVGNIFLELHGINTDSASAADTSRVLFSDDVRFRVDTYARMSDNGIYVMSADSLAGSTRDGTLSLRSLQVVPILSDAQLRRTLTRRTTRYRITASALEMSGIEYRGIFDNSSIAIRDIVLREPLLDVFLDRTLPPRSRAQPATLPHQSLQAVSWNLRLDTVRLEDGRLLYSERASDGARPGVMRFEEFTAVLLNLSNTALAIGERARMDLRTRLNGAGRLTAALEYDLSRRDLNMAFRGSITAMDASSFNEMLADLEGIKVESGRLDSAWFDVKVVRDNATGQVLVKYHDLKVAFQDKDTGSRGLFNVLKSFVANALKLRGGNPVRDGREATVAPVQLRRLPEVPLFGFMWYSLRSGLLATLGL